MHPFNTLAVRMSLRSASVSVAGAKAVRESSFYRYMMTTIKEQGVINLYSRLSAGILRLVFYATSRFGLFEVFRNEMAKYRPTDIWSRLSTGMLSGGVAAIISLPAEVTLVRISNDSTQPPEKRRNYKGVIDAFFVRRAPKHFLVVATPL